MPYRILVPPPSQRPLLRMAIKVQELCWRGWRGVADVGGVKRSLVCVGRRGGYVPQRALLLLPLPLRFEVWSHPQIGQEVKQLTEYSPTCKPCRCRRGPPTGVSKRRVR
jgi:hypothetical protein